MLQYARSVIFSLHFLGFLTSQHHQTHDVSVCGSLQTQMMYSLSKYLYIREAECGSVSSGTI